MRFCLLLLSAAAMICSPALAEPPRVVIERPAVDSVAATIDPADSVYQAKVDSLNAIMEQQIQEAIEQLERTFEDPKTEEEVGQLIGAIVMEKQLAMLDLEIDRALSLRDTLLIKGLEYGLEELLRHSPEAREFLHDQIDALETRFRAVNVGPE